MRGYGDGSRSGTSDRQLSPLGPLPEYRIQRVPGGLGAEALLERHRAWVGTLAIPAPVRPFSGDGLAWAQAESRDLVARAESLGRLVEDPASGHLRIPLFKRMALAWGMVGIVSRHVLQGFRGPAPAPRG